MNNIKDKHILKELKIFNTEREKHLNAEKYKEESINKCLKLEKQLSEALSELNHLKVLIKTKKQKKLKNLID